MTSRFLTIDTSDWSTRVEPVPERYRWHGGRELTSTLVHDMVDPRVDPLSEGNILVLATGLLAGTSAPNASRISAGGKSPLTGGIKESNVGGKAGFAMAQHDIRAVIIKGKPSDGSFRHVIISPDTGDPAGIKVELVDADKDKFLGNYELARKMLDKHGRGASIISIGPAGARQMHMASIAVLDLQNNPSRHCGRGGLGAVMGSKGVKSIVLLKGLVKPRYEDAETFKRVAGEWSKQLKVGKAGFSRLGTAITIGISQMVKGLPTRNFKMGTFDLADKIGGEALHEMIVARKGRFGLPCLPGCAIQCSNLVVDEQGQHVTSSLEYETICLNGSNLMIGDLDIIARVDGQCDDIGIDTIEFGGMMGVLMEAGVFEFGDIEAPFKVLDEIRAGSEQGRFWASGVARVGEKLGVKRIPARMRQGFPAYDPRVYKGMGVTYATSPMGADHTAGAAIFKRPGLKPLEYYGPLDEDEGKLQLSYELQVLIGALDMLGCCYFIGPTRDTLEKLATLLNARYGWKGNWEDLFEKAREMLKKELDFNKKAGIGKESMNLPKFLSEEPSLPSGKKWTFTDEEISTFWDKFLG